MENTTLISTPTEKEIDEMEEKDMIAMNEKAFPYVSNMFSAMIGPKQAFEECISISDPDEFMQNVSGGNSESS